MYAPWSLVKVGRRYQYKQLSRNAIARSGPITPFIAKALSMLVNVPEKAVWRLARLPSAVHDIANSRIRPHGTWFSWKVSLLLSPLSLRGSAQYVTPYTSR
jgi:hypothetical protein